MSQTPSVRRPVVGPHRRFLLHRRALLRGLAGAAVPLPLLEAMRPAMAASPAPRRYVVAFAGLSTHDPNAIVPSTVGKGYDTKRPLAPLAALGVRDHVSVISGLRLPPDGPGGWGTSLWHSASIGPLLCGVRTNGQSPVAKGVTSDQIVAGAIPSATRFRSLELRVQPQPYRENDARYGIISYRAGKDGGVQANEPTVSPRVAYDSLFSGLPKGTASGDALSKVTLADQRSVLDLVHVRSQRLVARLGTSDRTRLERHFDEIRDLEVRMALAVPIPQKGCSAPPDPGVDDAVNKDVASGYGRVVGYSNEEHRAEVMTSIVHLALACDMTRVISLAYTFAQCFISSKLLLGMNTNTDLHELGHASGTKDEKADVLAWPVKHFATLVAKLAGTPEGDGSILDNTALVLQFEGGWDGKDTHSGDNMVTLIAGHAGGLRTGTHIAATGVHPCKVLISAMNAVGYSGNNLGEISGNIPQLFTP